MDHARFDALARAAGIVSSRRAALLAIASTALAPLRGAGAAPEAAACLNEGRPCKRNTQCCSSRCQGKPGKKTCRPGDPSTCLRNGRGCNTGSQCCSGLCKKDGDGETRCRQAPNQSICTVRDNFCQSNADIDCGVGSANCFCLVTTAGRSVCTVFGFSCNDPCSTDTECVARIGRDAVCVRTDGCGGCGGGEDGVCVRLCPDPI